MTEKERQRILCKLQVYDAMFRSDGIFHLNGEDMEVYQTCARKEDILTFDKKKLLTALNLTLNKRELYDFQMEAIASYANPLVELRPQKEFFEENRIQATVAACIHDTVTKQILLLEIQKSNGIISDYTEGTLTFPQGHAAITDNDLQKAVTNGDIHRVLYENIVREIHEELKNTTPRGERGPWNIDAICTIAKDAPIVPIYVDKVGSSEKHICFLFNIDMASYHERWHNSNPLKDVDTSTIISNEPDKHIVRLPSVYNIHKVAKSNICPWVLRALSIL